MGNYIRLCYPAVMANEDPLIKAITPKTPWFVVLRPFSGDGRRYVRGEVVDTMLWKSTAQLVENRYLAPFPHGAVLPIPDANGIRIIDLDAEQEQIVPEKKRPTPSRKS